MKMKPNAFKFRGVVEGFYGDPWSHENRLLALDYFQQFGMNIYIIGPKNASWQRADWRSAFSMQFLKEAQELVQKGIERNIQVTFSISPGLNVCYSSEIDRQIVLDKFIQLSNLGVSHFCLMWDDIDWDLREQSDLAKYSYIEDAQAEFTNWILERLSESKSDFDFTICPMIYWGRNSSSYIKRLSLNLNSTINVMWTGRQIRSEYLDCSDAIQFISDSNRPPFYWDNFPVNNLNLRYQLHTGPVQNREENLSDHSVGLVANPMNQFWASLLPLSTIGKYLCNPREYDPWSAWNLSIEELFPNLNDREAAKIFFSAFTNSQISNESSPRLRGVLHSALQQIKVHNFVAANQIINKEVIEIRKAISRIYSEDFNWPQLKFDVSPWISKIETVTRVLEDIGNSLADLTQLPFVLATSNVKLEKSRFEAFGEALDEFIAELKYWHQDSYK